MSVNPRSAAQVLTEIAAHLEVHGESRFKARAYRAAARAIRGIDVEDLAPALENGELALARGLGPATVAVVRDLVHHGQSLYLEQLRTTTPDGLLEMLRVPGLTGPRVFAIHKALGVETVDQLEVAAQDGRLARVPQYGKTTVDRILAGIAMLRACGAQRLYPQARAEGERLLSMIGAQPDVVRVSVGGALRRHCETVGTVEIVAGCRADPRTVAATLSHIGGVRQSSGTGSTIELLFSDGVALRLHCVPDRDYGLALCASTGTSEHVAAVVARLVNRGFSLGATGLERNGEPIPTPTEEVVYEYAGLAYVDPAMREFRGEVEAAECRALPHLIANEDVRGVLHCHTVYSDGSATIEHMARAARARGWSYLGISDHSKAAFYAGGLSEAKIDLQMAEIDRLNASPRTGIRILKGIEVDILADGRLDYGPDVLDRFDFVIGAIHSRFAMRTDEMTDRILRAFDEPRLTILAHPTGRRLLSRDAYAIDVDTVLEGAAARGVAIELNADPHRLDLDWRYFGRARELGVRIVIGPDAHSVRGLDTTDIGVGMARKGWLEPDDVLNTGAVDDVLAFARARRGS